MLAKVRSGAIIGLDGAIIEVEVDISSGLPSFTIVGLPDATVQEAKERVHDAIRNSGCTFPMKRIVVNLAPADLKNAGPAYDLPIAICILLSSEQISAEVSDIMFLGELSLDGGLRHTNGVHHPGTLLEWRDRHQSRLYLQRHLCPVRCPER